MAGATFSSPATFPVKVGPSLVFHGFPGLDGVDGFVARINAEGTGLDYCGYIGGANFDLAYDVAVDGEYRANVVGTTQSAESTFPVKLGPDITHNGCSDVFCVPGEGGVARISNTVGTSAVATGKARGVRRWTAPGRFSWAGKPDRGCP